MGERPVKVASLALLAALVGCGGECRSFDDAYELNRRISEEMLELAESDPERLEEISERMREIGQRYGETRDPAWACEAYGAVAEELGL